MPILRFVSYFSFFLMMRSATLTVLLDITRCSAYSDITFSVSLLFSNKGIMSRLIFSISFSSLSWSKETISSIFSFITLKVSPILLPISSYLFSRDSLISLQRRALGRRLLVV